MAKKSDIEAAKTPEQKQCEYEEYMAKMNEIIAKEKEKQRKWQKIIDDLNSIRQ